MINTRESTIRDIVAEDFRAAAIFQKYGLDFCCGGDRSVQTACAGKGIADDEVIAELDELAASPSGGVPKFNRWELDLLADYIVGNHHRFVREAAPILLAHAEKVARVHGERHPEVVRIAQLCGKIVGELFSHMRKEEEILFPYIRSIALAARNGTPLQTPPFGSVRNPIRLMEMEHLAAGNESNEIRELSNNYTPPDDACMTYRVLFEELRSFEEDLHQHVHLENNILFPKAIALEGEMNRSAAPAACAI